jgi:hypothetical protein
MRLSARHGFDIGKRNNKTRARNLEMRINEMPSFLSAIASAQDNHFQSSAAIHLW